MSLIGDEELKRKLESLASKTDKIIAQVLTGLAYDARAEVQSRLPSWVKTTRPFLKNSVAYVGAKPDNLVSSVGFAERANFAELLEDGGTRSPLTSKSIAVPTDALKRNGKGGIALANRPKALLGKKGYYIERTQGGVAGLFKSTKKKPLEMLYVFKKKTEYRKPHMHFRETVREVITRTYEARFRNAVERAIQGIK